MPILDILPNFGNTGTWILIGIAASLINFIIVLAWKRKVLLAIIGSAILFFDGFLLFVHDYVIVNNLAKTATMTEQGSKAFISFVFFLLGIYIFMLALIRRKKA